MPQEEKSLRALEEQFATLAKNSTTAPISPMTPIAPMEMAPSAPMSMAQTPPEAGPPEEQPPEPAAEPPVQVDAHLTQFAKVNSRTILSTYPWLLQI